MVSEGVVGGPPVRLSRLKQLTPSLETASTQKERSVVVIGYSLLRGMKGTTCWADPTCREVCCLPSVQFRDISREPPGLFHFSDYHHLLVVQAGSAEKSLRTIKKDFKVLWWVVDGAGMQVFFSSISSVAGKVIERIRKIHIINKWLRGWYKN